MKRIGELLLARHFAFWIVIVVKLFLEIMNYSFDEYYAASQTHKLNMKWKKKWHLRVSQNKMKALKTVWCEWLKKQMEHFNTFKNLNDIKRMRNKINIYLMGLSPVNRLWASWEVLSTCSHLAMASIRSIPF